MTLKFFNSRSRQIEEFQPENSQCISMYVCGPTVYDFIHVGNARPIVVFDMLFRLLRLHFSKVNYVRNITDIDDKIISRSEQQGLDFQSFVNQYIGYYHEDVARLNTLPPTYEPLATESIPVILAMIETLIKRGYAYCTTGHVYFAVESSPLYGQLSNRSLVEMVAGSRVEVVQQKRHPMDFVLWKPSSDSQPGWHSPWGRGRPGWHIECSAMAKQFLGSQIDIHGGGQDLLFPHHENERIQSCCANETDELARYWIHNGYVTMSGRKMSKSLGNIFGLREVMNQFSPLAIRYLFLSTHYRKPLHWSELAIQAAENKLAKIYRTYQRHATHNSSFDEQISSYPAIQQQSLRSFLQALNDDLNTPLALRVLDAIISNLNKSDKSNRNDWLKALGWCLNQLGLWPVEALHSGSTEQLSSTEVEALITERIAAKKQKNYQLADQIRNQLKQQGVIIEDRPEGTQWRLQ